MAYCLVKHRDYFTFTYDDKGIRLDMGYVDVYVLFIVCDDITAEVLYRPVRSHLYVYGVRLCTGIPERRELCVDMRTGYGCVVPLSCTSELWSHRTAYTYHH
jgi:hypothetical protein